MEKVYILIQVVDVFWPKTMEGKGVRKLNLGRTFQMDGLHNSKDGKVGKQSSYW